MKKPKASLSAMIVVIIVFAASLILPVLRGESPIHLGLDLSGGVIVTYQPDLSSRLAIHQDTPTAELLELAKETLVSRLYRQLKTQPDVVVRSDQRIVVSIPSHLDSREILQLVGKTYHLTLRLVEERHQQPIADRELAPYRGAYLELAEAEFSGDMLDERAIRVETGARDSLEGGLDSARVTFRFKDPHDAAFSDFTTRHVGRELAILIDDQVEWSGVIESPITESGVLQGRYTLQEASEIAMILRSGTLPIPLEVESLSAIGPSLGQAMQDLGFAALGWSLILLAGILIIAYLHRSGLLITGLFSLAFLLFSIAGLVATLGLTLDLVGIAGLVLSVGMGMDAFLIIFEALERKLGTPHEGALHQDRIVAALYGFASEGKTLFHANASTLVVVGLLFATERLATFALFICVGVFASVLTIAVTRWLLLRHRGLPSRSGLDLFGRLRRLRPGVFRLRKLYFALLTSSFILTGCLLLAPINSGLSLELGNDFKPGTQIVVKSSSEASVEAALAELAEPWSDVTWRHQRLGDAAEGKYLITGGKALVTTLTDEPAATPQETSAALSPESLAATLLDHAVELESVASIDHRVSSRRLLQSLSIFGFSFLCLALYFMVLQEPLNRLFGLHRPTAARTRWQIFLSIVLAVVTDVLVVLTFLAVMQIPISLAVIAAILTIVGYSVNDSVVLWNHIQSHAAGRGESSVELVTRSVDSILSRAWLTSLSTMVPAIAILWVGLDPLADFAWTMIVGTVQGTLSSLFIVGSFAARALARSLERPPTSPGTC